jgi:hypothetical protein
MPRVLTPQEVAQLGLDSPAAGPRVLSPEEVQSLGLEDGPSEIRSFADGAGQGATLGFGDELEAGYKAAVKKLLPQSLGGTDKPLVDQYREDRDAIRARLEASRAANPGAYFAGNLVGGVAPMLVPGVGEAGLTNTLATGMGLGAAQGLGTSDADLTQGDVRGAIRDIAKGATLGTAGALAGTALTKVAAPIANSLREAGNGLAARALRGTAGQYRNLGPEGVQEVGENLLNKGAVRFGDSPSQVADRVAQLETNEGQNLGQTLQDLDATTAAAYRPGVFAPTGPAGSATVNMFTQPGGISKTELMQRMAQEADDLLQREGPAALPVVNKLRQEAENIGTMPGPDRMPFEVAEQYKTAFQRQGRYDKIRNSPGEIGAQEVAGVYRKAVEDEASKAAAQAGNPELAQRFMDAKKASGLAQKAADLSEGSEGRILARNQISPTGTATALTGVVTGHPIAGVVGGLAMSEVRKRAPASLAVAARGASNLLQRIAATDPSRLGVYGSILQRAFQTGGQKAYDSTSYVLSQTDPKYQELARKVTAEGDQDGGPP